MRKFTRIDYLIFGFFAVVFLISLFWMVEPQVNPKIWLINDYSVNEGNELSKYVTYDGETIEINIPEGEDADFETQQDVLKSFLPHLPFGVYNVHVEYTTEYDTLSNSYISLYSEYHRNSFLYTDMTLNGYKSMQDSLAWVTSIRGISDLQMRVNVKECGATSISSISMTEYFPWRIAVLLIEGMVFALYLLWRFVIRGWEPKRKLKLCFVCGIILFASLPVLTGHALVHIGHDYEFHIGRIASIANEMRYGNFPALYQSDAHNGYGYASLLMYGNLFLYIPAFCHFLGMPLTCTYKLYVILVNAATVGIAYYSFSKIFKERVWSFLGAVLYILAAYRVTNIFIRTAVGEYTAMAFFPLVLYGLYRLYWEKEKVRFVDCIPLILGISGIIQSHILSIEMLAIFIILYGLIHFKTSLKKIIPIMQSVFSVLLLNLFFIIPFIDTYSMDLMVKESESVDIADRALTLAEAFNVFMPESGRAYPWTTQLRMPLTIGFPLIIGFILFMVVFIYRKIWIKTKEEQIGFARICELFVYTGLSMWLASQSFPWKDLSGKGYMIIKALTGIQFPWRFLATATLFMVPVTIYSCTMLTRKMCTAETRKIITRIFFACMTLITVLIIGKFFTEFMYVTPMNQTLCESSNTPADSLYFLKGTVTNKGIEPSCNSNQTIVKRAGTDKYNVRYYEIAENPETSKIYLPMAYYSYLTVQDVNTKEYFETFAGEEGRLSFIAPSDYTGKILVTYQFKLLWKIGYIISILCLIILVIYILMQKNITAKKGNGGGR